MLSSMPKIRNMRGDVGGEHCHGIRPVRGQELLRDQDFLIKGKSSAT